MRLSAEHVTEHLDALQRRIEPAERFVHLLTESVSAPIFCDFGGTHAGFRYAKPDRQHFCLLKLVRAVSAVNAMIALARGGFTQEIAVLIRTVTECTTQIEFVLADVKPDGSVSDQAEQLVRDYFEDFGRNAPEDHKKSTVNQSTVHRRLGAQQDRMIAAGESAEKFAGIDSALLYKRISQSFSAYVHCKYPETMDLCGGHGPRFHLRGMSGTPKDVENIETIATFVETVVLSSRSIIVRLGLFELVQKDKEFFEWYRAESQIRWQAGKSA